MSLHCPFAIAPLGSFLHLCRSMGWSRAVEIFKFIIVMSKGSLFWANASGKLGESVFYRAGGEQRNRTYVKKIKNPRTRSQAIVRATMNNLVQTYKIGKGVFANTFPLRKSNQSAFNAFMAANKNAMSAVVGSYGASQGLSVPYGVYVAKGDDTVLGQMSVLTMGENASRFFGWQLNDSLAGVPAWLSTLMGGNQTLAISRDNIGALLQGLGLPADAKIAVVRYSYADEGFEFGSSVYSADGISNLGAAVNVAVPLSIDNLAIENEEPKFALGIAGATDPASEAEELFAVFVSYRNADGKKIVSTAQLQPSASGLGFIEQWLPNGEIYEQIVASLTGSQPII